jgi:phosphoserine phosphatase RsbU/P
MSQVIRVLIVEDSEDDALLLLHELRRGGYETVHRRVDTPAAMAEALEQETWDVITADHNMPQFSSAMALKLLQDKGLDVPFIIVSGTINEEAAVAAMRSGARDYLIKGKLKRLVPAVERELREAAKRREQRKAERALLAQQEQLRIARDIQQGLFPTAQLTSEDFDIAGASYPTEAVGGDYFDYIAMSEDDLGIVIGDITGHGLGASLLMAEMRACLRALALNCTDLGEILTRANRLTNDDFCQERFLTVLFARLSPRARSFEYLNAGHPSGYVMDRHGSIRAELKSSGMPLGIHPVTEFPPASSISLEPGDLVVLLTDGVLDAFASGEDDPGTSRVIELVSANRDRPAAEIVETLCRAARDAVPQGSQKDDITAVVLKAKFNGAGT